MTKPLVATQPNLSATVAASAGTGKTWLLVTRILRLLLAGATPGGITAITFTNKAASEMQERLRERAAFLATCDEQQLGHALNEIGLEASDTQCHTARHLYEQLLLSPQPVRTQTFHKFCMSLLQKFPMEADIPAGFELLDAANETFDQAWQELIARTTQGDDESSTLRSSMSALMLQTGSPASFRDMIKKFVDARIDWWTYTANANTGANTDTGTDSQDFTQWATRELRDVCGLSESDVDVDQLFADCVNSIFFNNFCAQLHAICSEYGTKAEQKKLPQHAIALGAEHSAEARFTALWGLVFTAKDENRKNILSGGTLKKVPDIDLDQFEHDSRDIRQLLRGVIDSIKAEKNCQLNYHWYVVGQAALEIFQQLKRQRRVLDFADLEWQTWRLLNQSDHAEWVQYKLDQRIEHLLVDEFQDTSPTQWQLLYPLLSAFAEQLQDDERQHTAFIVGDVKQAIYGFRRADHRILGRASHWLNTAMNAQTVPLSTSYRSADLIMQYTNAVFLRDGHLPPLLDNFPEHGTYRHSLWGQVELLNEMVEVTGGDAEDASYFRNPLLEPTPNPSNINAEAYQIAARIDELMASGTTVGDPPRPLSYSDILILLRSRTNAADIEHALLEHDIPFEGTDKGTLLEMPEISDMLALMRLLCTPFDDVACAHVLRSPIFSASNEDLIFIAERCQRHRGWYDTLMSQSSRDLSATLQRAQQQLADWQHWVDRLPSHDMLDRIYNQGNILQRFREAFPPHLAAKATANLRRFLSLALEQDSGRYPSISQLVAALDRKRSAEGDSPDAANVENDAGNQVKIMTIHGAKGLEAPVVFLADTARPTNKSEHSLVLTAWDEQRPQYFAYATKQKDLCQQLLHWKADRENANAIEENHLLYVALTRACQLLIISGNPGKNSKEKRGWRMLLETGFDCLPEDDIQVLDDRRVVHYPATVPVSHAAVNSPETPIIEIDETLGYPVKTHVHHANTQPSLIRLSDDNAVDEEQLHGIAIHYLLEHEGRLSLAKLANMLGLAPTDGRLSRWQAEADAVLNTPTVTRYLQLQAEQTDKQVLTEVEINYINEQQVSATGIIDRLIIDNTTQTLTIIDYKTHPLGDHESPDILAESHAPQLRRYAAGLRIIYPNHQHQLVIVFTNACLAIEVPDDRHL